MKLVIAEKPSVTNSLANAIGANIRKDGYLESNTANLYRSWSQNIMESLLDIRFKRAIIKIWKANFT